MSVKFDDLSKALQENVSYQLNDKGKQLLQRYYQFANDIEQALMPILKKYVPDPSVLKKDIAIQVLSTINSQEIGTKEFEVASRLDTLTSGGKNTIDGNKFVFNENDPVHLYIDRVK